VFIKDENNAFNKKWPSLVAKFGKTKKSNFYRIDSRFSGNSRFSLEEKRKSRINKLKRDVLLERGRGEMI
jgi:hypothetical protein